MIRNLMEKKFRPSSPGSSKYANFQRVSEWEKGVRSKRGDDALGLPSPILWTLIGGPHGVPKGSHGVPLQMLKSVARLGATLLSICAELRALRREA